MQIEQCNQEREFQKLEWLLIQLVLLNHHFSNSLHDFFLVSKLFFAQCQGFRNEFQLGYFKKCGDYHKAWDSICNIYRHAMAMELVWPYITTVSDPCVDGYLDWAKN